MSVCSEDAVYNVDKYTCGRVLQLLCELARFSCRVGATVTKFLGFGKFSSRSDLKSTIRVGIILS